MVLPAPLLLVAAALLPLAALLLWFAIQVARSARAMRAPHLRALPFPARSPVSLPRVLQPLLGAGNWGLVASARGLPARVVAEALVAKRDGCGGVFLTRTVFGAPVVVVMDLAAVRRIMFTTPYRYAKLDLTRRMVAPLLGWEGLVLSEGEQHRRLRVKVGKSMHHEAVAAFSAMFLEEAARLRDFLGEGYAGDDGVRVLRLREGVHAATCRTIVRAFFPRSVLTDARMARVLELYAAVLAGAGRFMRDFLVNAVLQFLPAAWLATDAGEKRAIRDVADEMLDEAAALHSGRSADEGRNEEESNGEDACAALCASKPSREPTSMVDFFLEEKRSARLSRRELLDNLQTFLAAGQITTRVSVTYALWRLAKHPVWQARVVSELEACVPVWRDASRHPAERVEAVCALPVLTRVLKESLRLYPPVSMFLRVLTESDELCGFRLEPGTNVAVPIQAIHCDSLVWDDPWTFDPDRFLPEREAARDSMAWLPFAYGPRGCVGQRFALREMAVLCAEVVRTFELSVDSNAKEFNPTSTGIYPFPDVQVYAKPRAQDVCNT